MAFILPPLPYTVDALEPHLTKENLELHHGKHHNAYVTKTNELIASDATLNSASLSAVITAAKEKGDKPLFNNAAQIWNHSFYWHCLSPEKQAPTGKLKTMIDDAFGSQAELVKALKAEAVGHFGSGWAWLVLDKDALKITSLHDADTPLVHDMTPLLTIDVWEHAYYVDYRNARPDYATALLENAINWEFVAQNLDGKGAERADQ